MADIKARPKINVSLQTSQSVGGSIREALLRGYSAYEVAVQNGFDGTEEEWLASLKGETGDTGPRGETGAPGKDGAPGRDGIDGINGVDGRDGLPGRDGIDGINGVDGYSPSAVVDQTANGATITITDKSGTTTATVTNGVDGKDGAAGKDGRDGVDGQPGADAVSPVITVSDITQGHRVSVVDVNGMQTFDILDGQDGKNGQDGADGSDGYSPSATVTKSNGVATITVTDKNGTTTATITDGQDGKDGQDGSQGAAGADGYSPSASVEKNNGTATITITDKNGTTTATVEDGKDGKDGAAGSDGFSPSATVTKSGNTATITITDKTGTTTATISDGQDGQPGQTGATGASGADGYSPTVTVTDITGGHRVSVMDANGTQTFDVMDGQGIEETVTTDNIPYSLNGYINSSGEFVENAYTVATDFAPLANATKIEITGANTTSGAMGYAFYTNAKTFISGVGGLTEDVTLTTFPSNAAYVRMSSRKSGYNPVAVITYTENSLLSEIEEDISEIKADIDQLETVEPLSSKIFRRVGCIGDSYTAGYVDNGTTVTLSAEDYAWPYHMSKLTGQIWTNFGKSGSTTKSWMARGDYSRLGEVEAAGNKCQAYVIGLMINDSNESSPRYTPIGTAADIGTNTDSYYANYYKLIKAVNAVNATAPIFCCTCPRTDEARFVTYNVAVRDLVDYCYDTEGLPVYLLDLADDRYNNTKYYKNPDFTQDALRGHFSPVGYEYMAECMMHVMADVINANVADFQAVHLIPYDAETLTYDKIRLMHPIETVSGAIASFPDGSDLFPAESCKVSIELVQDLHGYDSPWPAGGGKNKLRPRSVTSGTNNGITYECYADGTIKLNGTASGHFTLYIAGSSITDYEDVGIETGEYKLNGIPQNVPASIYVVSNSGSSTSVDGGGDATVSIDSEKLYRIFVRVSDGATVSNATVYPMIRLASVTDATFAPYSNICPISGWTGMNVSACGVNVWDEITEAGDINNNTGLPQDSTQTWRSKNFIPVVPGATYYLYKGVAYNLRYYWYDKDQNYISTNFWSSSVTGVAFNIPSNAFYMKIRSTGENPTYGNNISINYPSTDHDYHAYASSATIVPITWQSEAGTVYGGTLDVVSGELVVDRAFVDLGTLSWEVRTESGTGPNGYFRSPAIDNAKANTANNTIYTYGICSAFNTKVRPTNILDGSAHYALAIDANKRIRASRDDSTMNAATFKTYVTGVQFVYELDTSTTYHLTPQEVSLLLGDNNVWADCGDSEVKYRADIREYIKKVRS